MIEDLPCCHFLTKGLTQCHLGLSPQLLWVVLHPGESPSRIPANDLDTKEILLWDPKIKTSAFGRSQRSVVIFKYSKP